MDPELAERLTRIEERLTALESRGATSSSGADPASGQANWSRPDLSKLGAWGEQNPVLGLLALIVLLILLSHLI